MFSLPKEGPIVLSLTISTGADSEPERNNNASFDASFVVIEPDVWKRSLKTPLITALLITVSLGR